MIKVKIVSNNNIPLLRQTPGERGVWGNCHFFYNEDIPDYDFFVVYDSLPKRCKITCHPKNTILITGEPPIVKNMIVNLHHNFILF